VTHPLGDIQGVTLASVAGLSKDSDRVLFTAADGRRWSMLHEQDCCEHVWLEDVVGDVEDLIGHPILEATESSNHEEGSDYESRTWTFYRFSTVKGTVTLRWCGESNGYYSEAVSFERAGDE
jgi:hypothetical protein